MDKKDLRLYFIYGSRGGDIDASLHVIEQALKSGVTLFQLREKGDSALTGQRLQDFALSVKDLAARYNVPFVINDDVALAESVKADGVHLGQDDMNPGELPAYFDDKIVGLSVRDEAELAVSDLENVDYIGTGPIFATQSKDDAGDAIGLEGLKRMRNDIGNLPMVAIGGITHASYRECLTAGADGISVISAIADADDIKGAVHAFLD